MNSPAQPMTSSPVPLSVLRKRSQSVQAWMREQGLASLVVFGQGSAPGTATKSHGNLRYLFDWDAMNAVSAVILPAEGEPSLIIPNIFSSERAREVDTFADVTYVALPALAGAVLAKLPKEGRIGIAGREEMPLAIWEGLVAGGAASWINCGAELERRRSIKDEAQIAYHRKVAGIVDGMFERVGPLARAAVNSGRPAFELQVELEAYARNQGCEYANTWLTIMPAADRCRYHRDEGLLAPKEGDQVLLGVMVVYHGHWGHGIRMGSLGEPGQKIRDLYGIVRAMYDATLGELVPGKDLRDASAVCEAVFAPFATDIPPTDIFRFRAGHALGHSYEDPVGTGEFHHPYQGAPTVRPSLPVHPGMVFELHPNAFIKGRGGAAIGDMVLIGEKGPELLTRFPIDLGVY